MIQLFIKRLFDIVIAAIALIVLSPALVILAILVRLKLGSPILFCQQRPGLNAKAFTILKFRTMVNKQYDEDNKIIADSQRLTVFGKFLRNMSLDELPELFNVLKGDMSLVGPRPLMTKYLDRYTPRQGRRHEVKPGITGWAQVNGRNNVTWEKRFEMDVWYVDNWGLWLDLGILFKTVIAVFKREDINKQGHATVDEFMGTQQTK